MDLLSRFGVYASVPTGFNGPDGTNYFVPIVIQASEVSSALTDFPVYVDLSTMPADFWSNVQSDGGDIRVTTSDGVTQVPVELVAIDTSGETGELHFLATSVSSSSDTEFRLFYDAETVLSQPGVTDTYGRNAVWGDYLGVWHDGGYLNSVDGTTSTEGGSVNTGGATGKVGDATSFDGVDDYLRMPSSLSGNHDVISGWVNNGGFVREGSPLNFMSTPSNIVPLIRSGNMSSSATNESFSIVDGAGSIGITYTRDEETGWVHWAWVYNSTAGRYDLYLNGTLRTVYAWSQAGGHANRLANRQWEFGARTNRSEYSDHTADEARIRNFAISADWIAAEYTNQDTPTTFYNVGTQTQA